MKILRSTAAALLLSITMIVTSTSAFGRASMTMLGQDLKPQAVSLLSIRNGVISYFDSDRQYKTAQLDTFLQMRDIEATYDSQFILSLNLSRTRAMDQVRLTDGQLLIGHWLTDRKTVDDQSIYWAHPLLGEFAIPLQQVRSLHVGTTKQIDEDQSLAGDQIQLDNGDVVTGFVVAAGAKGLEIQLDNADQPVSLPYSAISALRLANPHEDQTTGHLLHLKQLGRVRVDRLDVVEERATLSQLHLKTDAQFEVPLWLIERADLHSPDRRLIDLADLPMSVSEGGQAFSSDMPPRVDGRDILVHAPVHIEFTLPVGTSRMAIEGVLNAEEDSAAAAWADFQVRIEMDGKVLGTYPISQKSRMFRMSAPAGGFKLGITLLPGRNGAVMDRLKLRNCVLLLQ